MKKKKTRLGERHLLLHDAVGDGHRRDEVDEAGRVAPLVVVPVTSRQSRVSMMPAPASKTVEQVSPMKSDDTTCGREGREVGERVRRVLWLKGWDEGCVVCSGVVLCGERGGRKVARTWSSV